MSERVSQICLSTAELDKLPATVRMKLQAAFGPASKVNSKWMLVGAHTDATAAAIEMAITRFADIAERHAHARQEKNIERLMEIITDDIPRTEADVETER